MFSLQFHPLIHFAILLLSLQITTSQYAPDDNVVRGGEFDSKPTGPADKEEGGGNSVVVLGVTLCLSVIFAIAGIFIGVYFHVERFLCYCCNKRNVDSKLEASDAPLYGSDKAKTANMFMTAGSNSAFTQDEEKSQNFSVAAENPNEAKEKKPSTAQFAPRRKPFFPPNTKKKKARETSLMVVDPIAFASSTTHVTDDGSIVRSADKNAWQPPPRTSRRNQNNETTYKSFSTQQDDILF